MVSNTKLMVSNTASVGITRMQKIGGSNAVKASVLHAKRIYHSSTSWRERFLRGRYGGQMTSLLIPNLKYFDEI